MSGGDEEKEEDMDKRIAGYKEQLRKLEQVSQRAAHEGICEIEEVTQQARRKIRRLEKA